MAIRITYWEMKNRDKRGVRSKSEHSKQQSYSFACAGACGGKQHPRIGSVMHGSYEGAFKCMNRKKI